jgi:hypothetical protein
MDTDMNSDMDKDKDKDKGMEMDIINYAEMLGFPISRCNTKTSKLRQTEKHLLTTFQLASKFLITQELCM